MSRIGGQGVQGPQMQGVQLQGAQQADQSKVGKFFATIGNGLKRAGKAIAHFFSVSVPNFFRGLAQRTATAVATDAAPRAAGGAKGTPQLRGLSADIDFSTATNFDVKDSGHGGVVVVDLPGSKAVIKGAGGASGHEILGARLAREVGLPAPETRLLAPAEKGAIRDAMGEAGAEMPHGREATIVMEFVDGVTMADLKHQDLGDLQGLAQSVGKWMAFDTILSEQDRFHGLVAGQGNGMAGINSSNFLVNPRDPSAGMVGIDQVAMSTETSKAYDGITSGSEMFFLRTAEALTRAVGSDVDPETLVDEIRDAAQEMIVRIGQTVTEDRLAELSDGLDVSSKISAALNDRLAAAREYARG